MAKHIFLQLLYALQNKENKLGKFLSTEQITYNI